MVSSGCFPFDAGKHVVAWEMKISTLGCVIFDAGSHMMRGKCKFSHEDVLP